MGGCDHLLKKWHKAGALLSHLGPHLGETIKERLNFCGSGSLPIKSFTDFIEGERAGPRGKQTRDHH